MDGWIARLQRPLFLLLNVPAPRSKSSIQPAVHSVNRPKVFYFFLSGVRNPQKFSPFPFSSIPTSHPPPPNHCCKVLHNMIFPATLSIYGERLRRNIGCANMMDGTAQHRRFFKEEFEWRTEYGAKGQSPRGKKTHFALLMIDHFQKKD